VRVLEPVQHARREETIRCFGRGLEALVLPVDADLVRIVGVPKDPLNRRLLSRSRRA
jgi:hypothetical protein